MHAAVVARHALLCGHGFSFIYIYIVHRYCGGKVIIVEGSFPCGYICTAHTNLPR